MAIDEEHVQATAEPKGTRVRNRTLISKLRSRTTERGWPICHPVEDQFLTPAVQKSEL